MIHDNLTFTKIQSRAATLLGGSQRCIQKVLVRCAQFRIVVGIACPLQAALYIV